MTFYLIKRLLVTLATLLAASVVVFAVLEVLPGNAAQVLMGPDADPAAVAAKAAELGLDAPAPARYLQWMGGLLRGDMGLSYAYGTPVAELVAERLQVTAPLALMAMLLACALALGAGLWAAARHGRWSDWALMTLSQAGMAVPGFWLGMLLVLLFAALVAVCTAGWLAGLRALLLPALALAAVQAAVLARFVRSSLLETLREDYVRTARAKGLGRHAVLMRHALRNALVPVVTVAAMQFAELLAGAVVVENVFYLPGLGRLVFQGIANRDLAVVRNCVMLLAGMVALINLAVDALHALIDPRLTHARRLRAP